MYMTHVTRIVSHVWVEHMLYHMDQMMPHVSDGDTCMLLYIAWAVRQVGNEIQVQGELIGKLDILANYKLWCLRLNFSIIWVRTKRKYSLCWMRRFGLSGTTAFGSLWGSVYRNPRTLRVAASSSCKLPNAPITDEIVPKNRSEHIHWIRVVRTRLMEMSMSKPIARNRGNMLPEIRLSL